jgi:hypothetical protein
MGKEHLKPTYSFQGEFRERHYVPPNSRQGLKEGDVAQLGDSIVNRHYGIQNLKVKILARYYTQNGWFRNYGSVIEILDGNDRHAKGKILHVHHPNWIGVVHAD